MRITILLTCCLSIAAHAQVIETKKGPVEILGLEESTPESLQAKLNRLPDGELHYCAADLKTGGFPEASVIIHVETGPKLYTVVTVVEPKRAAEVAYRPRPERQIEVPAPWAALRDVVHSGPVSLYRYSAIPSAAPASGPSPGWWPALRALDSETDYGKALEALGGSRDPVDRAIAAMVLLNFAGRDGAWQALAGGLRDPDTSVSGVSQAALSSLRAHAPRKVDWAPAAAELAAVLHGTNLFAFQDLLQALGATGIDPQLAAPLVGRGGGRLVLAYLRARHADERNAAHSLLVALRGADLGDQPEIWEAWISTL